MYRPTTISASAPTVNDDYSAGYRRGNHWWDTVTETLYILENEATGTADWNAVTSSSIASWDDWTPSFQWTGNTPAALAYVARYQEIGNLISFTLDVDATNDSGTSITNMNCSLPEFVADNNNYIPVSTFSYIDGTCGSTNVAYIDGLNDTPANRKLSHALFAEVAADLDFNLYFRGFYEKYVA